MPSMPNETRELPAANDGLYRFLGGSPLAVAFRLILLSILVGVVLAAIGFDPWNIVNSIRPAVSAHLGSRLRRHQLAVALLPARRRDRDPDLAAVADVRRAARAVEATAQAPFVSSPVQGHDRAGLRHRRTRDGREPDDAADRHRLDDRDRAARRCHAARRRGDRVGDFRLPVLAVRVPAHEHACVHGAGARRRRAQELRAILVRGFAVGGTDRRPLIVLQIPLAAILLGPMGGSEGVTRAAKTYFTIRIWSAPLVLANYVVLGWLIGQARAKLALSVQIAINLINVAATVLLVLVFDSGIAGAAIAAVIAEAAGPRARRPDRPASRPRTTMVPRAALLDRAKLMRMLAVNRDIMIRTAALIAVFLFFTAQGARAGDVTLAANAVLNNFLLISAFFLDGLANAAEQLCGRAYGARDREGFAGAVRLVDASGLAFLSRWPRSLRCSAPVLIDIMTASDGRAAHRARLFAVRDVGAAARRVRLCL